MGLAPTEDHPMLRTLFSVGMMAMVGLFLMKFVFGIFGGLVALVVVLAWWAIKILLIGACIYFVIRLLSPSTAQRMTDSFSKPSGD
jgi:hypothetical protein